MEEKETVQEDYRDCSDNSFDSLHLLRQSRNLVSSVKG